MTTNPVNQDAPVPMDMSPPAPPGEQEQGDKEPIYGGFSRFELELEVRLLPRRSPVLPRFLSTNGERRTES